MPPRKKDALTPLELKLMQALWALGSGTVTDVQQQVDSAPAYTTVQTMLNILERKGKVTRTLEGRAFRYKPTLSRSRALSSAVRDLVDRMCAGSAEELVMSLVKTKHLDAEKLAELSRRLQQEEEQ